MDANWMKHARSQHRTTFLALYNMRGPRGIHKQRDHKSEKGKRNIIDNNKSQDHLILYSSNQITKKEPTAEACVSKFDLSPIIFATMLLHNLKVL